MELNLNIDAHVCACEHHFLLKWSIFYGKIELQSPKEFFIVYVRASLIEENSCNAIEDVQIQFAGWENAYAEEFMNLWDSELRKMLWKDGNMQIIWIIICI